MRRAANIWYHVQCNGKFTLQRSIAAPMLLGCQAEMEGLLSKSERVEILEAATEKMKKESALDQNLDLKEIAAMTGNYNRVEIELLVKLAQGGALADDLEEGSGIKLKMNHFLKAMEDVKPAIESLEEELKSCSSSVLDA